MRVYFFKTYCLSILSIIDVVMSLSAQPKNKAEKRHDKFYYRASSNNCIVLLAETANENVLIKKGRQGYSYLFFYHLPGHHSKVTVGNSKAVNIYFTANNQWNYSPERWYRLYFTSQLKNERVVATVHGDSALFRNELKYNQPESKISFMTKKLKTNDYVITIPGPLRKGEYAFIGFGGERVSDSLIHPTVYSFRIE